LLLGQANKPVNEFFTVLVVQQAVGFESKMQIGEYCGFAE
jgi:hypothetical protein